jgi:CRISPR-associated protein Cmr3
MSGQLWMLRGVDPLLFRDGRPFSNEKGALSARTLPVPTPGTVAGFLRTQYGDRKGWDWDDPQAQQKASSISVSGPLLMCDREPVFAAPADAVVYRSEEGPNEALMTLRPIESMTQGAGSDLPHGLLPLKITEDVKPAPGYSLWGWRDLQPWLTDPMGDIRPLPSKLEPPPIEERVHVAIDPVTGRSDEGKLFTAQFVSFDHLCQDGNGYRLQEWSLLARMDVPEGDAPVRIGTFGGERRLAVIELAEPGQWPLCPQELTQKVAQSESVRLVLATPAIFTGGWKPGWLDDDLTGTPPGISGVRLKLISAAVKRREAVSGWDYANGVPKEARWMTPAGSVYFFKVVEGSAEPLTASGWLSPVSDQEQDRRDGYGLALWGVW